MDMAINFELEEDETAFNESMNEFGRATGEFVTSVFGI